MTTKDLIAKLKKLDPEGELELVAKSEDGWVYTVWGAELGQAHAGVLSEGEPNCVVLDTTT